MTPNYENSLKLKIAFQEKELNCMIENYLSLWIELSKAFNYKNIEILEKLLLKMQLNLFSLSNQLKGINFQNIKEIFDIPSIYTLSRTLIENYLTIEYLFVIENNKLDLTKIQRIDAYKIAGYNRLLENTTKPAIISKIKKEKAEVSNGEQNNSTQARIIGWSKLISKSNLNDQYFQRIWSIFSNYAHSEFIFIKGINNYISENKAYIERIECYKSTLIILSLLITEIVKMFPDLLSDKFKKNIEFYNSVNFYFKANKDPDNIVNAFLNQ